MKGEHRRSAPLWAILVYGVLGIAGVLAGGILAAVDGPLAAAPPVLAGGGLLFQAARWLRAWSE